VSDLHIRALYPDDWDAVRAIYRQGIDTGNATFETEVPMWKKWDAGHLQTCRLVALCDEQVVGWAALSPVSSRSVYAGVTEVSIYIATAARGQGVGKALLAALVEASEQHGIWTLQAGILAENETSIALHKSCGFCVVGRRERLGQMNGVWRDVILMERRSNVAGV
jgi:phosphinothricin acetyltransferase